jgi:hypothetical protein
MDLRDHSRRALLVAPFLLLLARPGLAAEAEPFVQIRALAELGFLSPLHHTAQFGKSATKLDYVDEGAQDVLFLFGRLSAELELARRHTVIFLYQPLDLPTQTRLRRDVTIDELTFPAGTAVDLRYNFDFYRMSYLYDLMGRYPRHELSLGFSLQIRNATINFTSADGSLRRAFRSLGPVPTIKARGRYTFDSGLWLGGEVDFMYAPVKYINGGDSDVEGAIVDLSLRAGYPVRSWANVFVNLRYIGGGAEGTSPDDDTVGDGFVANWLHFLTLSIGAEWSLIDPIS